VYKGYYALTTRDFKDAATNFLDSISTFTSYELMTYSKLVEYTILVSIISLKRAELGEKVRFCLFLLFFLTGIILIGISFDPPNSFFNPLSAKPLSEKSVFLL